jgi:methionine-rich copper-binding protein CopC
MLTRSSRRTSLGAVVAAAFVAASSALLPAPSAASSAAVHLRLTRTEPAKDSAFAGSPAVIRLWFSEPVRLKATSLKVTDAAGKVVGLGPLSRAAAKQAPVVAKVQAAMAPGHYTVTWRAMGNDSHVVKGQYTFTIVPAKRGSGR